MAIAVKIQNNDYIPAGEAGRIFGYTADYVTRLAREGKVAAQRIGKQWLVNADSLATFVASSSKNKELRSDRIRRERQLGRIQFQKKVVRAKAVPSPYTPVAFSDSLTLRVQALGLSVLVLFAGGVLGSFFYAAPIERGSEMVVALQTLSTESIFTDEAQIASVASTVDAVFESTHDVLKRIAIGVYTFANLSSSDSATLSYENPGAVDTRVDAMPVREGMVVLPGDASRAEIESVKTSFSDEVIVKPEGDGGTGMVQPVFRSRAGDEYRYVLVPIDSGR